MKEKEIENKIKAYLKSKDIFYFKEHGGAYGTAGIPDLICCVKGKFVGLEVKTSTGKVSALQEVMLRRIRKANGIAEIVRSVDDVKRVISLME